MENIEKIAESVPRWRHGETLDYVRKIEVNITRFFNRGRLMKASATARGLTRQRRDAIIPRCDHSSNVIGHD